MDSTGYIFNICAYTNSYMHLITIDEERVRVLVGTYGQSLGGEKDW